MLHYCTESWNIEIHAIKQQYWNKESHFLSNWEENIGNPNHASILIHLKLSCILETWKFKDIINVKVLSCKLNEKWFL